MKRRTRRYHSAYRTSAVRRRGTAAGWMLGAVVAGLALYLALAMGLGNWLHDRLAGEAETEGTPESVETIDLTPVPQHEITETVAFPAVEAFALTAGKYETLEEAKQSAAEFAARGGAGFVRSEEGYTVLLSAYESEQACRNVAERMRREEKIESDVQTICAEPVEMKLTASARRIDGVRDAFAVWQQTGRLLSDLWQDLDAGVCTQEQALQRLETQCEKLRTARENAFEGVLIEDADGALSGLDTVMKKAEEKIAQIIDNPPENVLELSSEIKYTGIGNLTEYQSYTAMIYE